MCNCFDDTLEAIKSAANEQLGSSKCVDGSIEVKWRNQVFYFGDKQSGVGVALYVDTSYLPKKKDGTHAKSRKKLENGFKMKFCPFCGGKFGG